MQAKKRKTKKGVAKIEEEIALMEQKKSELEAKMSQPAVYSNGEKARQVQKEIDEIVAKLDDLNIKWEAAMENLEA